MHVPDVRTADEPLAGLWRSAEVVALVLRRGGQQPEPGALAGAVAGDLGLDLAAVTSAEKANGRAGETTRLPVPPGEGLPARVVLLGVGAGAARAAARRSPASVPHGGAVSSCAPWAR